MPVPGSWCSLCPYRPGRRQWVAGPTAGALSGCSAVAGGAVPGALSEQAAWLVAAPPPGNPLALFKGQGQFNGAVVKGSSIIFSSSLSLSLERGFASVGCRVVVFAHSGCSASAVVRVGSGVCAFSGAEMWNNFLPGSQRSGLLLATAARWFVGYKFFPDTRNCRSSGCHRLLRSPGSSCTGYASTLRFQS